MIGRNDSATYGVVVESFADKMTYLIDIAHKYEIKGGEVFKKWYVNGYLLLLLPVLGMFFCGLVSGFLPTLEYNRALIFGGEWWRLWTGHFVHWSGEHLFWDLFAFVILAYLLWKERRVVYCWILLSTPILISLCMLLFNPELISYRGVSGVDSALFFALALCYVRTKDFGLSMLGIGMCLAGIFKLWYECFFHQSLFVSAESFCVTYSAHWAGAVLGIFLVWVDFTLPKCIANWHNSIKKNG